MTPKDRNDRRKELGREGEDIACSFLENRGLEVIERNFRAGHNEIDIICRDGNDLRFVEVKTRKLPMEGSPLDAVDTVKQRRISRAANAYLASESRRRSMPVLDECHFDVVTVVWEQSGRWNDTEYVPDAFFIFNV